MVKNPPAKQKTAYEMLACDWSSDVCSSIYPWVGKIHGEGMATHSSILAREIPWAEKLGELQSIGSQRVGHNFTTKQQLLYVRTLKVLD